MADLRISQLPYATGAADVQRNDDIVIERAGSSYKARLSGRLLLPAFTQADAGKRVEIGSNGTLVAVSAPQTGGWALRATQTISPLPSIAGAGYSQGIASFDVTDYADTLVNLSLAGGGIYSFRIPPLTGVIYAKEGWKVWWQNNSSLSFIRPASADVVDTIQVYGQAA